jgi:phenylalanyl-tRNA synthetase beta chain
VSIRRTGHRFALRSEASLRFEKGQEFRLARIGADRVAQLTLAWAGGSCARGLVDTAPNEPASPRLAFRPARVSKLLGAEIDTAEQRDLLSRVGIATEPAPAGSRITVAAEPKPLVLDPGSEDVLMAVVPSWRRDLEIEADVAEEVARVRGYETTPSHLPDTLMPAYRPSPAIVRDAIRDMLAGAGLTEVITHALIAPGDESRLKWPGDGDLPYVQPASGAVISVTNPLSSQHSALRQHLVASLLGVLALNERQGQSDVAIFEIGKGYGRESDIPREWTRLAFLLSGNAQPAAWNRPARSFDLDDGKGLVELLCRRLHLPAPAYSPDSRGFPLHPGRALTAEARTDAESVVGRVAELHPDALEMWELRVQRVIVAELEIRGLDSPAVRSIHVEPIARFPVVERDLAVIVGEDRTSAEVEATIGRHGGDLLRGQSLFDLYRGAPLAAEEKSLAYRLIFGAEDRTLTEAEIDAAVAAVRTGLETDLSAHIRS